MLQDLGVWKISVSLKVTGSKLELRIFKTIMLDFGPSQPGGKFKFFFETRFKAFRNISELVCYLSTSHQLENFLKNSKPVTPEPGLPQVMRLRMHESAPRVATRFKNVGKSKNMSSPSGNCHQFNNFLKLFELVFKKNFNLEAFRPT